MNKRKLLERARSNPRNVRFPDLVAPADAFGYTMDRTAGSHRIYQQPNVPERLNFQAGEHGKAVPSSSVPTNPRRLRTSHGGRVVIRNFPIAISWSEEDDAYFADLPDFRHCSAWGHAAEEAPREPLIADARLAAAREQGVPLLDRRDSPYLPAIAQKALRTVAAT